MRIIKRIDDALELVGVITSCLEDFQAGKMPKASILTAYSATCALLTALRELECSSGEEEHKPCVYCSL